jgi:endonuclease YncB( thermonuclease family)
VRAVAVILATAFFAFWAAGPAGAAGRSPEAKLLDALPQLARGPVASVPDGATLVLRDGTAVRLAGIEPVLAAPGRSTRWEDAARAVLSLLVEGHEVSIRGIKAEQDRYGRLAAQVVRDDGLWLEGELVSAGAARVEPPAPGLARWLLKHETYARRRSLGIWQSPLYQVRAPDELDRQSGSFTLVAAEIGAVEERSGTIWLDLGAGTAARIDRPAKRLFREAGLDPADLAGRKLLLRGWVRWQGRPVLDLTDPDAVQFLPGRRRRAAP